MKLIIYAHIVYPGAGYQQQNQMHYPNLGYHGNQTSYRQWLHKKGNFNEKGIFKANYLLPA